MSKKSMMEKLGLNEDDFKPKSKITSTEDAICELASIIADQENAIAELASIIEGGEKNG